MLQRVQEGGAFFLPALPFAPRKVPAQQAEVPRACLNPRFVSPLLVTLASLSPALIFRFHRCLAPSSLLPGQGLGMMHRAPSHCGGLQPLPPPPLPSHLHFPALAASFWKAGGSGAASSLDVGVREARAPIPATPFLLGFMTVAKDSTPGNLHFLVCKVEKTVATLWGGCGDEARFRAHCPACGERSFG